MFDNSQFWILVCISLIFCCMGFKRFVWFMSVGYGTSSFAIGADLIVLGIANKNLSPVFVLHCVLMMIYGIRLGGFLLIREMHNTTYRKKLAEVGGDAKVPIFVSAFMWLYCGFMYVCQAGGLVYRQMNGTAGTATVAAWIGFGISLLGVVLEAVADKQKSKEKKVNPDLPAMHGVFKFSRCANYFGEMLFWTGIIVSGIGSLQGSEWILAIIGWVEIIFIMISGAKRVETRHIKHYQNNPDYVKYADSTPLLIPFIPLYHMTDPEKIKKEEEAKAAKKAAREAKMAERKAAKK